MGRQRKDADSAQTEQVNITSETNAAGEELVDAKIERSGTAEAPITKNKVYEEFQVEAQYEDVTDQMGKVLGRKLTGFEKKKDKPIRTTAITPERAEYLNSQSENTGVRLYEKEGE